ncbi:unnamed protein product, partial [Sphagnum tenellum]
MELQQTTADKSADWTADASAETPQDASLNLGSVGSSDKREPALVVYVAACVAAVGGLLFGYDMGVISGAKVQMQRDLVLSCAEVGSVVAFLPIGGFFASLIGGHAVDKYGRKRTIIANAFLFTFGALVLAFSTNLFFLLSGRFILGFAVSLSAIAECIYISEIATAEKRGMLVSLNELGITVGILVAFLVNYIFADTASGWRFMFGLSSVVAVAQGIAMLFLPQTPQFLMISRQEEKAEQTLRRLQLTTNVRQTMTNIRLSLAEESSQQSFLSILCQNADNIGSRLLIGCGLVFFQQFSGQPNIIYYAADIFKQVGFCTEWSSTLATVALGVMKVLSTVVSLVLVDRIGRRKALLAGISAMMLSVLVLSVFAFYQDHAGGVAMSETCTEVVGVSAIAGNHSLAPTPSPEEGTFRHLEVADANGTFRDFSVLFEADGCGVASSVPKSFRYLAFAALVCFVCAYSFSFGPITWVILSEIFPASSKGRAMALATALNWLGNSLVSATFLGAT